MDDLIVGVVYIVVLIGIVIFGVYDEIRNNKDKPMTGDDASSIFLIAVAWPVIAMLFLSAGMAHGIEKSFTYVVNKLKGL